MSPGDMRQRVLSAADEYKRAWDDHHRIREAWLRMELHEKSGSALDRLLEAEARMQEAHGALVRAAKAMP